MATSPVKERARQDADHADSTPDVQVMKSEHIDAKRILLVVPLEDLRFLEIRALLLERLGSHQEALKYVFRVLTNIL